MPRRRFILPFLLCTLATLATGARAFAVEHTEDTLETVKKNLEEKKAILVDVREQAEWDAGHLAAARLVPLSTLAAEGAPADLPKDTIVYGHCRSGNRALKAAAILQKAGYDFRPLKQGYADLAGAGFQKAGGAEKAPEEHADKKKAAKDEAPHAEGSEAKAKPGQDAEKPEQKPKQDAKSEKAENTGEKGDAEGAGTAPRNAAELPPCCR